MIKQLSQSPLIELREIHHKNESFLRNSVRARYTTTTSFSSLMSSMRKSGLACVQLIACSDPVRNGTRGNAGILAG